MPRKTRKVRRYEPEERAILVALAHLRTRLKRLGGELPSPDEPVTGKDCAITRRIEIEKSHTIDYMHLTAAGDVNHELEIGRCLGRLLIHHELVPADRHDPVSLSFRLPTRKESRLFRDLPPVEWRRGQSLELS